MREDLSQGFQKVLQILQDPDNEFSGMVDVKALENASTVLRLE